MTISDFAPRGNARPDDRARNLHADASGTLPPGYVLDPMSAAPRPLTDEAVGLPSSGGRWVVETPAPKIGGRWVVETPAPAAGTLTPVDHDPFAPIVTHDAAGLPNPPQYVDAPSSPAPVPEVDHVQAALDGLRLGAQGAARGVGDLVGAPVDLATGALKAGSWMAERAVNAIPGADGVDLPSIEGAPIGGSENLADLGSLAAEAASIPPLDVETLPLKDRIAYSANRFGTSSLIGGGALRGPAMSRAANPARKPVLGDALMQPYAGGATKPHIDDVAAATGSAAALEAVREYLPESWQGPFMEFAATMLGGAGGVTASRTAMSPAGVPRTIRDNMTARDVPYVEVDGEKLAPTNRAADRAAEFVQSQLTDPKAFADKVRSGAAEFRDMGAAPPAVGALSDDPGALLLQNAARGTDPKPFIENERALASKAAESIASVRPPTIKSTDQLALPRNVARATAETAVSGAEAQVQRAALDVKTRERALAEAQTRELETAGPYRTTEAAADQAAASRQLDDLIVDKTMRPRQTAKNERYAQIDPDGSVSRSVAPLANAATKLRESVGVLNDPAAVLPQGLLQRIDAAQAAGGNVSFRDIIDLRPEVSAAILKATKEGNTLLAGNLRTLKREIASEANRLAAEGGPGSEAAREANRYFAEEFAPFFGSGTLGGDLRRAVNRDPTRSATPPSATAERFLFAGAGGPEAAADLNNILSIAPNPEAGQQAVRNYVVASLAKTLGVDGRPNLNAVRKWRSNWSGPLKEMPAVQTEVDGLIKNLVNGRKQQAGLQSDLERFGAELKQAEGALAETKRRVGTGVLQVLIENDPQNAVAKVFGRGDAESAAREIKKLVDPRKHPEAWAAWKASVTDYLAAQASLKAGDTVDPRALKAFFESKRAALATVYEPAEMQALHRAQKLLEPFGRTVSGKAGEPALPGAEGAWRSLEVALKAYYGVLKGGGVLRTVRIASKMLPNDAKTVPALVSRMMFDPELAAHLATREVNRVDTPKWNARLAALLGGARAAQSDRAAPDEDDKGQTRKGGAK